MCAQVLCVVHAYLPPVLVYTADVIRCTRSVCWHKACCTNILRLPHCHGTQDLPYSPITEWRKYKYLIFVDGITFR